MSRTGDELRALMVERYAHSGTTLAAVIAHCERFERPGSPAEVRRRLAIETRNRSGDLAARFDDSPAEIRRRRRQLLAELDIAGEV